MVWYPNHRLQKQKQTTWLKLGRKTELTFFQWRYTVDQQVCEKVLNITKHQENANQIAQWDVTSQHVEFVQSKR